ncbi:hypothetical protein SAMN04487948_13214 [Halogranum amylolyticum]|uniref:Dolichyl-phosphate-mannose-protein mannosyltransferase n=1 Tax=Halogranum amylolyticum TaxID=660520 RepID=A0A1H8WK93_9EURY|nr:hypothetical protein [Halogranum amylolyticum]SEP28071.1 hypothetical protein SAMN04487948_13214 [Halogranum amylolyticum]
MGIGTRFRAYDRLAAVLGIVAALALLPLQLFVSHIYAQTIPVVVGGASAVYLFATRRQTATRPFRLPRVAAHLLPPIVVFGSAALVLLAHTQGRRTGLFYVAAAALGTLVLAQVLFVDDADLHPGVVLGQILVFAGVVRFSSLLTTPGFVGIDVWVHIPEFTQGMLSANSIGGMGQTKYVMAPLYHLLVGTTALFADVSLRTALYLSLGVTMPLFVFFVYLLSRTLVPTRWALFATALYAFSDSVIRWSIHLIPTSLGLAFFLAVLYLVVRVMQQPTGLGETFLLLFFFVAQAFTHQVSSFITLVLLLAGWVTRLGIRAGLFDRQLGGDDGFDLDRSGAIPFGGYFAFNLGLLTLIWSLTPYYGQPFLKTAFLFFWNSIGGGLSDVAGAASGGGGGGGGAGGAAPTFLEFVVLNFDTIGFLLLLFGTTVGSLYALRRGRTNQAVLTLVVAVVLMTLFTLVPPLVGIGTFLSGRWFAFLYAGMAVLSAVGFEYLQRGLSPKVFLVLLLVILYAFPMVMIASPKATVDSPMMENDRPRYSFTEQELAARDTVLDTTTGSPTDPIYTDHPYTSLLNPHGEPRFGTARIPPDGVASHDEVLYREYQRTGAPVFRTGMGTQRIYPIEEGVICSGRHETVYSNGDVKLCRSV